MKLTLILAITAIGMVSCANSEELIPDGHLLESSMARISVADEVFTAHAIYKGVTYSSTAVIKNDSLYYLDEGFNKLIETIITTPGSVAFVRNDSCTEYFDTQEDFFSKYGIRELNEQEVTNLKTVQKLNQYPVTHSITGNYQNAYNQMQDDDMAYVGLFDDKYFSDTHLYLHLKDPLEIQDISHMKSVGLNDKVSSLMIRYNMDDREACALLEVWEDSYFNHEDNDRTKHRTYFMASYVQSTNAVGDLKKVSCFHAHDSWNDRISSISFHIGYIDSLPDEY